MGEIIVGVALLIVGAVAVVDAVLATALLGAALPEYLKRSKIRVSGPETSTIGSHRIATVAISNPPCFSGINLGRTTLFGWKTLSGRPTGLRVERHPAECSAVLEDADGGAMGLYFLITGADGAQIPASQAVVGGRDSASVCLFARQVEQPEYFVYQAANSADIEPKVPSLAARYSNTREFTLRIHVVNNTKTMRVPVKVRRHLDGKLYVHHPHGSALF